jgi:hypothetical protein
MTMVPSHLHEIVSDDVVQRAVIKAEIPPRKPPIFSLIPLDNKGVIVIHDHDPKTLRTIGDVFDKKGTYRGSVVLPEIPVSIFEGFFGNPTRLLFRDGYAYAMEYVDGEANLVRYRYELKPAN